MKINNVKSSNYNKVNTDSIIRYGRIYSRNIMNIFNSEITEDNINRTQLKAIVAELETIDKKLNYYVRGIY